jgi:hypothetical protein
MRIKNQILKVLTMVYDIRNYGFSDLYITKLRLALTKGPVCPSSPEDGNRSSFRNVVSCSS